MMRRGKLSRLSVYAVAAIALAVPSSAPSQMAEPSGIRHTPRSVFENAHGGQVFRVSLGSGERVEGRFVSLDNGSATFANARAVRLDEVTGVWQRGTHWVHGGIIGGLIGLLPGAALGVVANAACEFDCSGLGPSLAAGMGVGAVGGFALGAGIGYLVPRWKLRYP